MAEILYRDASGRVRKTTNILDTAQPGATIITQSQLTPTEMAQLADSTAINVPGLNPRGQTLSTANQTELNTLGVDQGGFNLDNTYKGIDSATSVAAPSTVGLVPDPTAGQQLNFAEFSDLRGDASVADYTQYNPNATTADIAGPQSDGLFGTGISKAEAGVGLGALNVGLGYLGYRDQKRMNEKSREAIDQNLVAARDDLAATRKFRAAYGLA